MNDESTSRIQYGTFWLPDAPEDSIAGKLIIDPLKRVGLEALEPTFDLFSTGKNGVATFPSSDVVPLVHGMTDVGYFSLLNCGFAGFSMGLASTQLVRATIALQGVHVSKPDVKVFRRCEVELPSLQGLLGDYPVQPNRSTLDRDMASFEVLVRSGKLEWDDGKTSFEIRYDHTMRSGRTNFKTDMRPVLTMSSAHPRSAFEWFFEWVVPVNQMSSLLTGHKANPLSVDLFVKRAGITRTEEAPIHLFAQGVGTNVYEGNAYEVLARAADIDSAPDGIHSVLQRYRELAAKHEVYLELLMGAIRYPDRPKRNLYLDVMAALEAFDTRESGIAPAVDGGSLERAESIVQRAKAGGVGGSDLKHLKSRLKGRSSYTLEQRLERLGSLTGRPSGWKIGANEMADIRNDIAHGNVGVDANLEDAYSQAVELARSIVLLKLGIETGSGS